jgi:carboxylesterase
MARHPWLDPSAFYIEGGPVGALLIHGFTGAPTEMRGLGDHLAARGYTVSAPLLPGHGTSADDLAGRRWTEWAAAVQDAYDELSSRCDQLFVTGLSLGTLLTLNLVAENPAAGIALYAPAIFFSNPLTKVSWIANVLPLNVPQSSAGSDLVDPEADKRAWCYETIPGRAAHQVTMLSRRVRRLLSSVTIPILVVMSRGDGQLKYESGPYVIEHIGSQDKELLTLDNSGHNIMVDAQREMVWERTASFMERLAAPLT